MASPGSGTPVLSSVQAEEDDQVAVVLDEGQDPIHGPTVYCGREPQGFRHGLPISSSGRPWTMGARA